MSDLIGFVAAFLTTASFIPQVIHTLKTKDTSGVSLLMYSMFVVGVFLWLVYGILIKNNAIIASNIITLILSGMVLAMKIKASFKLYQS